MSGSRPELAGAATVAHKPVVGEVTAELKQLGAPRELIAWATGRPIGQIWEECDRPEWLCWLAVVEELPLVALVDAAADCAQRACRVLASRSRRQPLADAIAAARARESVEHCRAAAEACEDIAKSPHREDYRKAPPERYRWAAHAAALAARSAESLLGAEARRAAERDTVARDRAAAVGAGDQIFGRGEFEPIIFQPGDLAELCFESALESMHASVCALAPQQVDEEERERVEASLSERVFARLDPIREGLLAGKPAGELVARVELAPYGADKLAPAEEQIELPKKTAIAVAAGLFVPLGSAHHYSEHVVLGSTLSVGCIVWLVAGMVAVPGAFTGWAVLVAIDVLLGPSALRRRNRGAIWSPSRQLTVGVVAIVVSLLAVLLSG